MGALDLRLTQLLKASRADSTIAGYESGWKHWLQFTSMLSLPLWLDGSPSSKKDHCEQLTRFVAFLESSASLRHKTCVGYLNAVRQMHLRHFGEDVLCEFLGDGTLTSLVLAGVERVQRLQGLHTARKLPLTWPLVCQLYPLFGVARPDVMAAIGLGVAFMLRGSELVVCPRTRHHLLVGDVLFFWGDPSSTPDRVRIHIKSSKTSPEPATRWYKANGTALCVVSWLWQHWSSLGAAPFFRLDCFPVLPVLSSRPRSNVGSCG